MTAKCIISKTYQGFVAKLHIPDDSHQQPINTEAFPTPILVVDTSGSMGNHAGRLIRKILPNTLERLKYSCSTIVHLITFESRTSYFKSTCDELRKFGSFTQGGTNMSEVPDYVKGILKPSSHGYLILTVSDGGIMDQDKTQMNAAKLASTVQSLAAPINSHAIRFNTGYGQADTRALSSILQLDNSGLEVAVKDIDYSWTDDNVVEGLISAVSRDGNFSLSSVPLTVENATVRRFPWEASGGSSIPLNGNDEVFWLDAVPTLMTVDGKDVTIECNDTFLDRSAYQKTLGKYLDGIMQRARLLKVVGTDDTRGQLTRMLDYFEKLERMWTTAEDSLNENEEDRSLPILLLRSRRLKRSLQKSTQSLRHRLNAILNDDKVSNMNSSQQADYLRTVDNSKNAKGLAKRGAASQGAFDFDTETRREVRAMHAHLAELSDVDDSNHMVSFYSRSTTLDGIKTVCELAEDDTLDAASTAQIIELFNIVGFPCDAPIGDFPDPMTYRISEVFPHCQVSLADVLVYAVDSQGQDLKTPATDRKILNVVPVFEDPRIVDFLRKYAPTLLEYVASVGMRRIIVDVPKTMAYTMLAGVWKMMETLGDARQRPSEVAIRTFLYMLDQLPTTVGRAFAHTLPLLAHPNDDEKTAYHLMHNGVTNMLFALLHGIRKGEKFDIAKLLRALYSFEVWQAVRKQYRAVDGECERMKNKLFDVDFDKWCVPVAPLFAADTRPEDVSATWPSEMCDSYTKEVFKCCWYVDVVTYIPDMFGTAVTVKNESIGEKVDKFKQLEPLTNERKAQTLGVSNLTKFRNAVLLQALTYTTKKSRVDENTELPLLPDPGCENETKKLSDTVLKDIYLSRYKSDLAKKTAEEDSILIDELVAALLAAADVTKFAQLVNDGVTRGARTLKINNASSAAFQKLYAALFTAAPEAAVPAHGEKLAFIIAGATEDRKQTWNNGNLLLPFRKTWFAIFSAIKREDLWSYLRKLQRERVHRYREAKANRHSHSNDKVSYWAMGYATMDQMRTEVDEETWKEYLRVHTNCCGCSKGDYMGAL